MGRSQWFTVAAFAGVLAFGPAAATQCGGPGSGPLPTTTTTTTEAPFAPYHQVVVAPSDAPAGAVVNVRGSGCASDAGEINIYLETTESPSTHLATSFAVAWPSWLPGPGNWSADLTIPQGVAPGSDYIIDAQCWGDGTPFHQPGIQVEYFAYDTYPFTVDAAS
jgi:hypothetical protein